MNRICEILDEKVSLSLCYPELDSRSSYKELITFVADCAGRDRRYVIDAPKLENELAWKADEMFDTGIIKTIKLYWEKNK